MKFFFRLIKLCALLLLLALIFHNFTARLLLIVGLRHYLGVPVEVQGARVDFLNTQIIFEGIRIKNPPDFPHGILADISTVFVDFEISSLFKGRLYFDEIVVHFEELRALRIPDGRLNLMALRPLKDQRDVSQERADEGKTPFPPTFYRFVLNLRRAVFTDLSGPVPNQKTFDLKLEQAVYRHVGSLKDVFEIIVWETTKRMGL